MANFQTFESSQDISRYDLPLNRDVKLKQWGGDANKERLNVSLEKPVNGLTLSVLTDSLAAASTAFTLYGTVKGALGSVVASGVTAGSYSASLAVRVCGEPKACDGYDVDLVSELAINGNGSQIKTYSDILGGRSDKHNALSQDPDKPVLDCGDVAGAYGTKLFGKKSSDTWFVYYLPPKDNKRDNLRFNPTLMDAKIKRIKILLKQGISVRVWVADDDGFSIPVIQSNAANTHFITLVGYSERYSKFMYIDPWPGGSRMSYDGGMYSPTVVNFLGELFYDPQDLEKGIRSSNAAIALSEAGMGYTIIAGP